MSDLWATEQSEKTELPDLTAVGHKKSLSDFHHRISGKTGHAF
jgi:hypothetical protein